MSLEYEPSSEPLHISANQSSPGGRLLVRLDLSDNDLGDDGATALVPVRGCVCVCVCVCFSEREIERETERERDRESSCV